MVTAAEQVGGRRSPAPIWDVDHVDAGHHLEQFTDDVLRRAVAGRRHVDSARIGLGIGDELRDCLGRNRWMHHHDISYPRDATDRCDVSHEIEAEICVERSVDRIRAICKSV